MRYLWFYHWHCILPAMAIIASIFLMRSTDYVSAEKHSADDSNDNKNLEEINHEK